MKTIKQETKRLLNAEGVAHTDFSSSGEVKIFHSLWKAKAYKNQQIRKGDRIRVRDIKNLFLITEKI